MTRLACRGIPGAQTGGDYAESPAAVKRAGPLAGPAVDPRGRRAIPSRRVVSASDPTSSAPRLGRLFLAFFAVWALANLPAVRRPWWYLDDFCQDLSAIGVAHNIGLGRPGQFLMVASFALEDHGRNPGANILLRLAQGALHALAAALLAAVLHARTRRRATLLAALPFLLSPFAAEPALWRSASPYPLAAVLSLAGLRLMEKRRGAGAGLVVGAMLTQPLGAFAAAGAWCLAAGLSVLENGRAAWHRLRAEAWRLAIAYGAGAAAVLAVAATQDEPWRSRVDLAVDWRSRALVLADANVTFFDRSFLAQWGAIGHLHALFPALAVAVPLVAAARDCRTARRALAAVAVTASALLVPYAPLLPVGESLLPDRLFYLAALAHCGAWALAEHAWRAVRWLRGLAAVLLIALSSAYAVVTWTIAPVYREVYQADLRLLRDLEDKARATNAESLFVCAPSETANANPHGVDFRRGPVRLSAFLTGWSAEGILEWQSTLPVTKDEDLRGACCVHCDWTRGPSFHGLRLEEGPAYCGCAP